jgi:hypothetical protein
MGEKTLQLLGSKPVRMGLTTEATKIAKDSLTIGLRGAVGIGPIAEHLPHLVH